MAFSVMVFAIIVLLLFLGVLLLGSVAGSLREISVSLKNLENGTSPFLTRTEPHPQSAGTNGENRALSASLLADLESQSRAALARKDWDQAMERIEQIRHLDVPERHERADRLAELWIEGRASHSLDLQAQLAAARTANDPETVLSLYGKLTSLIEPEARAQSDKEQVGWFLRLLMKRMRTGTVGEDVANLAERVANTFSKTPEGASLRASLGTLRRSAGLCAVCAQKYNGVESACPNCLKKPTQTPAPVPEPAPDVLKNEEIPDKPDDPYKEFH